MQAKTLLSFYNTSFLVAGENDSLHSIPSRNNDALKIWNIFTICWSALELKIGKCLTIFLSIIFMETNFVPRAIFLLALIAERCTGDKVVWKKPDFKDLPSCK